MENQEKVTLDIQLDEASYMRAKKLASQKGITVEKLFSLAIKQAIASKEKSNDNN